jgi:hypothetical protein
MLKILRIQPCENNKSCIIFHRKSNKIGFAFFWFFYDFLRNLQESAKCTSLFKIRFAAGTLESFKLLHMCPCFAERPSGRFFTSQSGPWAPAGGGPAKFRRIAGRARAGEGPWVPRGRFQGLDGAVRRLARGRRWPSAVGAAACVPARQGPRRRLGGGWGLE